MGGLANAPVPTRATNATAVPKRANNFCISLFLLLRVLIFTNAFSAFSKITSRCPLQAFCFSWQALALEATGIFDSSKENSCCRACLFYGRTRTKRFLTLQWPGEGGG